MVSDTKQMISMAMDAIRKEYGDDFTFEDGDEFVFALSNCTMLLSYQNKTFGIKIIGMRPIELDTSCALIGE